MCQPHLCEHLYAQRQRQPLLLLADGRDGALQDPLLLPPVLPPPKHEVMRAERVAVAAAKWGVERTLPQVALAVAVAWCVTKSGPAVSSA
jgi:hypothetical protein